MSKAIYQATAKSRGLTIGSKVRIQHVDEEHPSETIYTIERLKGRDGTHAALSGGAFLPISMLVKVEETNG